MVAEGLKGGWGFSQVDRKFEWSKDAILTCLTSFLGNNWKYVKISGWWGQKCACPRPNLFSTKGHKMCSVARYYFAMKKLFFLATIDFCTCELGMSPCDIYLIKWLNHTYSWFPGRLMTRSRGRMCINTRLTQGAIVCVWGERKCTFRTTTVTQMLKNT